MRRRMKYYVVIGHFEDKWIDYGGGLAEMLKNDRCEVVNIETYQKNDIPLFNVFGLDRTLGNILSSGLPYISIITVECEIRDKRRWESFGFAVFSNRRSI